MAFDYLQARKDGYSVKEINDYLKKSGRNFNIEAAINDGYSDKEIHDYLTKTSGVKKEAKTTPFQEPEMQPFEVDEELSTNDINENKAAILKRKYEIEKEKIRKEAETSNIFGRTAEGKKESESVTEFFLEAKTLGANILGSLGFENETIKKIQKQGKEYQDIKNQYLNLSDAIDDNKKYIPAAEEKFGKPLIELTPQEYAETKKQIVDPNYKEGESKSNVGAARVKQLQDDYSSYVKALNSKIAINDNILKDEGFYNNLQKTVNELKNLETLLNKPETASNKEIYKNISNGYLAKYNEYQNLISDPRYISILQVEQKKKQLQSEFDKDIKKTVSDVKGYEVNQDELDRLFEENPNWQITKNAVGKAASKTLALVLKLPKSLGDVLTTKELPIIGQLDDYFYNVGTATEMASERNLGSSTKMMRNISQKYADYKGYRFLVDDDNKAYSVRNTDFGKAIVSDESKLIEEFNNLKEKPKIEKDFSGQSLFQQSSDVLADIGALALSGRGIAAGLGKLTKLKDVTRANIAGTAAIYTQTYGDFYKSLAQDDNLTESEKNRYAMANGLALSLVSQYFGGFEKSLSNPNFKSKLFGEISKYKNQLINGEVSATQVAYNATKKLLGSAAKNIAEEEMEEVVLEPLEQMAIDKVHNAITNKNSYNVPGVEETKNTIIATALPVAATNVVQNPYTKNAQLKALLTDLQEKISDKNYEDVGQYYSDLIGLKRTSSSDNAINAIKLAEKYGKGDNSTLIDLLFRGSELSASLNKSTNEIEKSNLREKLNKVEESAKKILNGEEVSFYTNKDKPETEEVVVEKPAEVVLPTQSIEVTTDEVFAKVEPPKEYAEWWGTDPDAKKEATIIVDKINSGAELSQTEKEFADLFKLEDAILNAKNSKQNEEVKSIEVKAKESDVESTAEGLTIEAKKILSLESNGVNFDLFDNGKLMQIAKDNNIELAEGATNNEIIQSLKNKQNEEANVKPVSKGVQGVRIEGQAGQESPELRAKEEVTTALSDVVEPTQQEIMNDVKNKNFTTVEYKSEQEIPDVWKNKVTSSGENNGKKIFRITLPTSQFEYESQTGISKKVGEYPTDRKSQSLLSKEQIESTAKALEDKKSSLDEKAKKLGYTDIKQFNTQNLLNENLTDAEKALLQEYSDFQQEIRNLKDENVIAKLLDDEFSSWSKANDITRDGLGKVVQDEEIELAAKRIRILNARGDSKNAELELKKLKESKRKDNWTIESWKERFDEDIEQSEIDDTNSYNKEFNKSLDKAVESLLSKEQTLTALKDVESTAKDIEVERFENDGRLGEYYAPMGEGYEGYGKNKKVSVISKDANVVELDNSERYLKSKGDKIADESVAKKLGTNSWSKAFEKMNTEDLSNAEITDIEKYTKVLYREAQLAVKDFVLKENPSTDVIKFKIEDEVNPIQYWVLNKKALKDKSESLLSKEQTPKTDINDFQYVIDKANKAGGGVKGSGTKKINLSDRETAILNKTIEKLEAKAVANNGASFDPNETINIQYEKINGKEQKINTYTVDGYSIKYKYNSGKSMTEITTPQGDLLIVSKQYGKTEIAYLGKSESLLSKEQAPKTKSDTKAVEQSLTEIKSGKSFYDVVRENKLTDEQSIELAKQLAESKELPKKQFAKKDKIANDFDYNDNIDVKPIDKPIKTGKTKIESILNIASKDDLRPVLSSIYFDKDNIIATDAVKLVVLKNTDTDDKVIELFSDAVEKGYSNTLSPTDRKSVAQKISNELKQSGLNGKILNFRNGLIQDGNYPNYDAVIPKNNPIKRKVKVKEWLSQLNGLAETKKFFENPIAVRIKIGEQVFAFNSELMRDVFTVMAEQGVTEVELQLSQPNRALVIESNKGVMGLVMPFYIGEEYRGGAKTLLETEMTIAEKNGVVQQEIDSLEERRKEKNNELKEAIQKFRNATAANAYSLEFDVNYHKKRLAEIDAEIAEKKSELIDNPLQEKEDLQTIKTSIENGEITAKQAIEYVAKSTKRTRKAKQSIEIIESKAESESEAELNEAIDNADKLIKGEVKSLKEQVKEETLNKESNIAITTKTSTNENERNKRNEEAEAIRSEKLLEERGQEPQAEIAPISLEEKVSLISDPVALNKVTEGTHMVVSKEKAPVEVKNTIKWEQAQIVKKLKKLQKLIDCE